MMGGFTMWMFSLHFLPLEFCLMAALFIFAVIPNCTYLSLMVLIAGFLCTVVLLVILPPSPFKSNGPYHVGIRHITTDCSVYFPTLVKPIQGEPWLPNSDTHYVRDIAILAGLKTMCLNHLKLVRIPCTRNANIVSVINHNGDPRNIFVISHMIKTHHLAYSSLAMALAARGAMVCSVLHSDTYIADDKNESDISTSCLSSLLLKRVEEITRVLNGIVSGDLLCYLHVPSEDRHAFVSAKTKIHLIGHGLGAISMLALASNDPSLSSRIGTITSLDASPPMMLKDFLQSGALASLSKNISVQLIDSEEWSSRTDYSIQMNELMQQLLSMGTLCVRKVLDRTNHTSITDLALLTPLTKRMSYAAKRSTTIIPMVATEIKQFLEYGGNSVI